MKLVSTRSWNIICDVTGLRGGVYEVLASHGCCTVHVGVWLPTFRDNVTGHLEFDCLTVDDEAVCCPETLVTAYQHIPLNVPEERRLQTIVIYLYFKEIHYTTGF
jgi:hypothetical protein